MDASSRAVEIAYVDVPVWRHDTIQGEPIDREGLPFSPDLFSEVVPFQVNALHNSEDNPLLSATLPAYIPGPTHGRSSEVGRQGKALGIWSDKHGNIYSSLSIKGANASDISIIPSDTAPSGYIPYGLQEDDALVRVLRSSRMLREAGVAAEWIVETLEPQAFPIKGELVGKEVLKQVLIEQVLENKRLKDHLPTIATALGKMAFFVTIRSSDISERIWDIECRRFLHLGEKKKADIRQTFVEKTFKLYNAQHSNEENFTPLNPTNPRHVTLYMTGILPSRIGQNYGKLHSLGLAHRFPHFGNVTMLGGIVDLDSVHGEALKLGDAPITTDDILDDITELMSNFSNGYKNTLEAMTQSGIAHSNTNYHMTEVTFLKGYLQAQMGTNVNYDIIELFACSVSANGQDMTTRGEYILESIKDILSDRSSLSTLWDPEKLANAVDLELEHYSKLIAESPEFAAVCEVDELVEEELNNQRGLEVIQAKLDDIIQRAHQKICQVESQYTYTLVVRAVASHLLPVLRQGIKDEISDRRLERLSRTLAATHIDITDPRLRPDFYDIPELFNVMQTYKDNIHNQHDITEIAEITQWDTQVGGVLAGKIYYQSNPVDSEAFFKAISTLPENFVIHEVTEDLDLQDQWSWLKPMCYFTDTEEFVFEHLAKVGSYQLVPKLSFGANYVALCTEKDSTGKHHVLVWKKAA